MPDLFLTVAAILASDWVEKHNVNVHANSPEHAMHHEHKALFKGMGNIKNVQFTLDIDPTVTPIAQRPYRISENMKMNVNSKLEEMRQEAIIEKV